VVCWLLPELPHRHASGEKYNQDESEYGEQYGGSMEFWDSLSPDRQQLCRNVVEEIRKELSTPKE